VVVGERALGNLVVALLVWTTSLGIVALAWKRRLPVEVALLAAALILLVAWGAPLAVES
jgi:hypothetical protein